MELGKILEFRKDLYFEGAVQADWFYSKEKAAKVAENFVFHGKQYFGADDQGMVEKKNDTISLVEELAEKCRMIMLMLLHWLLRITEQVNTSCCDFRTNFFRKRIYATYV